MKKLWSNYKYRFTPWLMFSLRNRACRVVDSAVSDDGKIVTDERCTADLLKYFHFLHRISTISLKSIHKEHLNEFGFSLKIMPSKIDSAGFGVYISDGVARKGSLVALYPGLIYEPGDPILLPSIINSYVFRCEDATLIDGKGHGLSGYLYESCVLRSGRYASNGQLTADLSWKFVTKPFSSMIERERQLQSIYNLRSVGQIVNNQNSNHPANVVYQEIALPYYKVPVEQRQYIPYTYFSSEPHDNIKIVCLYTLRDVRPEEELLSNYFTMIL